MRIPVVRTHVQQRSVVALSSVAPAIIVLRIQRPPSVHREQVLRCPIPTLTIQYPRFHEYITSSTEPKKQQMNDNVRMSARPRYIQIITDRTNEKTPPHSLHLPRYNGRVVQRDHLNQSSTTLPLVLPRISHSDASLLWCWLTRAGGVNQDLSLTLLAQLILRPLVNNLTVLT